MKVKNVIFDEYSFGMTQNSLRMLRNTIALWVKDNILIVEIPTKYSCWGFLIFNKDFQSVAYTGDGFRRDGMGEGGRDYRRAKFLFACFGINLKTFGKAVTIADGFEISKTEVEKELFSLAQEIVNSFNDTKDYCKPAENDFNIDEMCKIAKELKEFSIWY